MRIMRSCESAKQIDKYEKYATNESTATGWTKRG